MKKLFLCAAVAMLALVGCEKQEQSSLSFEDAKTDAKITGSLVYYADKAGANTEEVKLANQRVYFQVAANQYATGAIGVKSFEATTDADGVFTITVPMGSKAITGDLLTDVIVVGEAPNRIFLDETKQTITLNAGDAKVKKCVAPINDALTACQGTATLSGKVTYNAGLVKKGDATEDGIVAAPGDLKISVRVPYSSVNAGEDRTLIGRTKADGSYEMEIPVPAGKAIAGADIDIDQFAGKYTEMFNNKPLEVDAIFGLAAVENANLTDGKVTEKNLNAVAITKAEASEKNTMIPVALELSMTAEDLKYSTTKNEESKVEKSILDKVPYANKAAKIEFRHMDKGSVVGKIIYDVNTDKKGLVAQANYAVYDSWKFDDIDIVVIIDKFAVSNYEHFFREVGEVNSKGEYKANTFDPVTYWGKGSGKSVENHYDSQTDIAGTYKLESAAYKYDGFFPVKIVAKATFSLPQSSVDALIGVGHTDLDQDDKGNTLYDSGINYVAGVEY